MIPYTYHLYHRPTGKHYYGVQYGKNAHPSNLWVSYFTSSKKVKALIELFGKDSFDVEVRRTFKTRAEAKTWEDKVIRRLNAAHRTDWLNMSDGGKTFFHDGFTEESRQKMSASQSKRRHSDETKARIANALRGKKWSAEHRANNIAAKLGKTHTPEAKAKMSESRKNPIQTPDGLFRTKSAAADHYGVAIITITRWMKANPTEFYLLNP